MTDRVTQATVTLHIDNCYESGHEIETQAIAVVPLPVPDEGSEERSNWEFLNIYPHTGTGHTTGDSWYNVEIIASTEPALIGLTFEFGY
jgi:hypothetical protein